MATTQDKHFFNLHTSGIGYINRIRWIEPGRKSAGRRSAPFLACSISALRGDSDDVSYTYFDVRVSGEEAIDIVDKLREPIDAQRKVIVSFKIGDIYTHLYERDVRGKDRRPTGEKEMAALIKGRLLLIHSVSIDGENVYTRERPAAKAASPLEELHEFWDSEYGDEAPVREESDGVVQPAREPRDPPTAPSSTAPKAVATPRPENFQRARSDERAEALA